MEADSNINQDNYIGMLGNVAFKSMIFLFIPLLFILPLWQAPSIYDEGIIASGAWRVMSGELPYRDFWTIYPPGQILIVAMLYKAFTTTLLTSRLYDAALRYLALLLIYVITKRITNLRLGSFWGMLAAGILLLRANIFSYPVWPAFFISLCVILCYLLYSQKNASGWLVLSGILCGISAFFRWDIALYCGVALVVEIILTGGLSVKTDFSNSWKRVILFAGSAVFIVLFLYSILIMICGVENVLNLVFLFPVTVLQSVRSKYYPSIIPDSLSESVMRSWFGFYFPIFVFITLILLLIFKHKDKDSIIHQPGFLSYSLFGVLLFMQSLSRFDLIHSLPSLIVLSSLVVSDCVTIILSKKQKLILKLSSGLAILIFIAYLIPSIGRISKSIKQYPPFESNTMIARAGGVHLDANQENALLFILQNVPESEPVYVGNQSHERIFVNDVLFNFLAERHSPTYYNELHQGVATTEYVQQRIISELDSLGVNYIVILNVSVPDDEPLLVGGSNQLDIFIHKNYRGVVRFGDYMILQRLLNPNKVNT